jgi:AcrR family transcriptional regulator
MGTRDTQTRIVDAALTLFNEHGTAAVSTNRIAEHCGISKGNLHYHFQNKQEIIRFLFQRMVEEMDAGWYRDHLAATLQHMAAMFVRQLHHILDYRFFYCEMADLLRRDKVLRRRFAHNRERRIAELERFFDALEQHGLMRLPADPRRLRSIVDITWIISENWLNYVEYHDRELTLEAVVAGYDEILEVLRPYLIGDPQRVTSESYSTLERLTAQN